MCAVNNGVVQGPAKAKYQKENPSVPLFSLCNACVYTFDNGIAYIAQRSRMQKSEPNLRSRYRKPTTAPGNHSNCIKNSRNRRIPIHKPKNVALYTKCPARA